MTVTPYRAASAAIERISSADVNQLLGIAPAERLNGLVRHLVARDASAALAELDATIASGVEVGLLLDQLVGYFRDVMTIAVGCKPEQMLYALPSQAAEVAEIGRQLGLSTVLAFGQILDHTGARLRVSMHARTLAEMAIVRICQLGELEDLAALVAELRGAPAESPAKATTPAAAESRSSGSLLASIQEQVAKKNDEPRPVTQPVAQEAARPTTPVPSTPASPITSAPPVAVSSPTFAAPVATPPAATATNGANETHVRRADPAHGEESTPKEVRELATSPATERESVFEKFKLAMAGGGLPPKAESAAPRVSRREQLAQVGEQPFVKRAMELFDVAPDKIRYSPPGGESN